MRLVSIDIDPQNRSNRIHLGPFVAGLNAVWGARGAGKSTIAKFIRGLLYHRHRDSSGYGQEAVDGLVGSLQWADTAGTSRVISSADSTTDRDYCLDGPYHFGRQNSLRVDGSYPHSNTIEQPWHRIGGEIYDAVFCGRLGETLPERLWQAARELGIHVSTGHQHDETYRRLKAEQHRLEQRLHHLRVDDRDRAWWTMERDRLVGRAEEIRLNPELHVLPAASNGASMAAAYSSAAYGLNGSPLNTASYREWESQLVALRAEVSELDARFAELSRAILEHRRGTESDTKYRSNLELPPSNGRYSRSSTAEQDQYGTWVGYAKPRVMPQSNTATVAELHREQEVIAARKAEIATQMETLQSKLHLDRSTLSRRATSSWELEEIQQRILYAEEVLKSWDLYETTRKRLAEVQQQLRGNGPYNDAVKGSFLATVERYVRELSAGALRRLPTWALEALRRDLGFAAGLSQHGRAESYREVYRDYRPDLNHRDHAVPPSQSSERQLVELGIRMAILDSAAHRIGRLPLILDDALDGFHGATLDHLVRVLIEFAREGQQVLLMTSEPEVAQRVRSHHGWVAQLNAPLVAVAAPTVDTVSYVQPARYSTLAPAAFEGYRTYDPNYADINAQLSAIAENQVSPPYTAHGNISHGIDGGWYDTALQSVTPRNVYRFNDYPRSTESMNSFHAAPSQSRRTTTRTVATNSIPAVTHYLSVRSPVEDGPNMLARVTQSGETLAGGLRSLGIHSVGAFLNADPVSIANRIGHFEISVDEIADRQAEQRLMCTIPNLRSFDARVLVGCGIYNAADLSAMPSGRLLKTLERFLTTARGQEILRSGSNFEVARMTTWLASAGRTVSRHRVSRDSQERSARRDRSERQRRTNRSERARLRTSARTQASTDYPSTRRAASASLVNPLPRVERTVRVERPIQEVTRTVQSNSSKTSSAADSSLRFYLDLSSPVVDAPSIGQRMAERLQAVGIHTVNDFLRANPATLASQLDDKRINAGTILEWQQQSTLVCRIPNLRGHDAQQLVASGITTVEQLISSNVASLVSKVAAYSSSKAGQRVLRGAVGADEAEIRDWMRWASNCRIIRAA